jgi:CheY-like chemotaxis protein
MDRKEFNGLLKDLIAHLHDYSALEKHPLTSTIPLPVGYKGGQGEYVQKLVFGAIDKLKPVSIDYSLGAMEWRPYAILHGRYVDGLSSQALSLKLSLSERQLRREHSRALQALAGRLWEQLFEHPREEGAASLQAFETHQELLDLNEVVSGVARIQQSRAQIEATQLHVTLAQELEPILADRIILRQVLIGLCNYAFHLQFDQVIHLTTGRHAENTCVCIQANVDENWAAWDADEREDLLDTARVWSQKIDARIEIDTPARGQAGVLALRLLLPSSSHPTILVVDDQQPTQRMIQRYLSRSNFRVIGVSDPTQALSLARQARPSVILLDVMMPHIDGWEILQALQVDTQTCHIPVIVCTAWEATELAKSLGAADFLKKPVTQKSLLEALERLNIPL